jgi:hypothetical protein
VAGGALVALRRYCDEDGVGPTSNLLNACSMGASGDKANNLDKPQSSALMARSGKAGRLT